MKRYILAAGLFLLTTLDVAAETPYMLYERKKIKWGEPTLGTPASLTYTVLDTPYEFTGGYDRSLCRTMYPLSYVLAAAHVSLETFLEETDRAFKKWEELAGIRFTYVASVDEADVLIGAYLPPTSSYIAMANMRVLSSGKEVNTITKGAICLHLLKPWRAGPEPKAVPGFERTMGHEIGHVFGLDHAPSESGAVMAIDLSDRTLQQWDADTVRHLYGLPR